MIKCNSSTGAILSTNSVNYGGTNNYLGGNQIGMKYVNSLIYIKLRFANAPISE